MKDKKEELQRALEQGDFISVGEPIKEESELNIVQESIPDVELKYQQFNHPIGVDFNKSFHPIDYLSCNRIIIRGIEIQNYEDRLRYYNESLLTQLKIGNIEDFSKKICDLIQNENIFQNWFIKPQKGTKNHFILANLIPEQIFQSLINVLGDFCKKYRNNSQIWIKNEDFLQYISEDNNYKTILKNWRKTNPIRIEYVKESMVYENILQKILLLKIKIQSTSFWIDIRNNIINGDFQAVYEMLQTKISCEVMEFLDENLIQQNKGTNSEYNHSNIQKIKENNNEFVYHQLIVLWFFNKLNLRDYLDKSNSSQM